MREYQAQKKIKRRIFSKLSIVALAILFFFLAKSTYGLYQKDVESSQNLARVNSSLAETQSRFQSLSQENQRLQTTEGIEEEIRHKFQVSKEGENVIVVVDDQDSTSDATSTPSLFSRLKYDILSLFNH